MTRGRFGRVGRRQMPAQPFHFDKFSNIFSGMFSNIFSNMLENLSKNILNHKLPETLLDKLQPRPWCYSNRVEGSPIRSVSMLVSLALAGTLLPPALGDQPSPTRSLHQTERQNESQSKSQAENQNQNNIDQNEKQENNQQEQTEERQAKPDEKPGKSEPKKRPGPGGLEDIPQVAPNVLLPQVLHFTWWNNSLMNGTVSLAGRPTFSIFSTGLSANTLSPESVEALKLDLVTTPPLTVHSLNDTRTTSTVTLNRLRFNQMSLELPRVAVLDSSELFLGQPEPGAPPLWLGLPFFAAFQVTLDYENANIILEHSTTKLPRINNMVVLPLEIRNGRLQTRLSIPDIGSFPAIIDTGTLGTLIPYAIAQKLKLPPRKTFTISRPHGTIAHASLIIVPQLQIGPLVQEQVPALYFEKPEVPKPTKNTPKSGTGTPISKTPVASPANTPNNTQNNTPITPQGTSTDTKPAPATAPPSSGAPPSLPAGPPGSPPSTPNTPNKSVSGEATAPATVKEKPEEIPDKTLDYTMGVIGNDFLRHYKVIINIQQRKLILIPPAPKPGEEGYIPKPMPDKKPSPTPQPRNGNLPRQF